ncbi:MAG: lytic transglycosylase domain-containing protein [Lachnospiraceae bacterium]|nr:lytic transglycosylase domain-containing protein [Lachnospiraceae bacterium]
MSTVTSIDQIRPSSYQNNIQVNRTVSTGDGSGSFQTILNGVNQSEISAKAWEWVRRDKISDSDNGQYDAIFAEASATYQLPVSLLKAIVKVESDFNPNDVSSKGAKGLMQLMPSTAAEVGVTDPFDPRQNIMGATKYIKKQLDRFGDLRVALAAYNTGPGNVKKYGGEPDYCKWYVDKVLAYAQEAQGDTGMNYNNLLGNAYGLSGNGYGVLGSLGSYGMLGGLGSLGYGTIGGLGSSLGLMGSLGSSSYSMLSGLGSGSYNMLGSLGGSNYGLLGSGNYGMLSGLGSSYGMFGNSYNALSSLLSADVAQNSGAENGDTVTMSRESFNSLIELMRVQTMMGAERTVGTMSLI